MNTLERLDEKRELYDRYGYEGVKAGGDPNPQPDLSGFFPHGGHPSQARGRPQGFDFGFDSPFFSSFGVPAGAGGFHGGFFSTSSSSPPSSTSQQPYTIESVYGGNHATLHDIFSGGELRVIICFFFVLEISFVFLAQPH